MILLGLSLYACFFFGYLVSRAVPDEIEASRAYVRLVPNASLMLFLVLALYPLRTWLSLLALAIIPLARLRWHYPLLSGLALGIAILTQNPQLHLIALLAIPANFLAGALEERQPAFLGLPQPVMMLAASLL